MGVPLRTEKKSPELAEAVGAWRERGGASDQSDTRWPLSGPERGMSGLKG